jgi:murein L,D-transpeptidase YafK
MIKKFLAVGLIGATLYANDLASIVEDYRVNGEKNIISQIENILQSKEYWQKKLANKDLEYGYYEKVNHILVCDKSKPELALYTNKDSKLTHEKTLSAIVGKKKGDKQKEGDLKTPIGAYDLVKRLDTVDQFYGPLAFVTSYPNMYDKLQGKNGYGIWIHGLPIKDEREDKNNTKGCIAIKNDSLSQLSKEIDFKSSILIVGEEKVQKTSVDEISTILSSLYQWRDAWAKSDIDRYLEFYDKSFIRWDGKKYNIFKMMKTRIFKNKSKKRIIFKDFSIAPYPTTDGTKMFRINFYEEYSSNTYNFKGNKELYIKLENNKIKILAEQ